MRTEILCGLLCGYLVACESPPPKTTVPVPTRRLNIKNHKYLTVDDGYLTELHGYDLTTFEGLEVDNLEFPLDSLTPQHALAIAVEYCDTAMVKAMLEDGIDPNFRFEGDALITSIVYCRATSVRLAQLFLTHGADINDSDAEMITSYPMPSASAIWIWSNLSFPRVETWIKGMTN